MLQACREQELHEEPADAEEDQVNPLPRVGRQSKIHARDCEQCHGTHDGGPGCEIVHGDEGVGSLADPTNGGVG